MTTSSAKSFGLAGRNARGFTLVEVLITAAIGSFVLAGVLAAFLFMGRSGALLSNYVRLEQQARRGLERFGEDTRMANALTSTGSPINQVQLTLPHLNDNATDTVTWTWNSTSKTLTRQKVTRDASNATLSTKTEQILSNIDSLSFARWTAGSTSGVQATGDSTTDQLQIHLMLKLQANETGVSSSAVAAATNLVVSARFILRNKS